MNSIDISPEAIAHIKALAQKATPGPWLNPGRQFIVSVVSKEEPIICDVKSENTRNDIAYIAAAHPGVILAMCEEIGRLRAQVATQEVLSGEDDACMTQLEVERDALEEQVAHLEKEADWLALVLANACCGIPLSEYIDMDSNGMSPPGPEHWREAARKAVGGEVR